MSFQEDDLHLVKIGDRIINLDRIDFVKFKAEEKHGPSTSPAALEIYFGSSADYLPLTGSEAKGLYSFLDHLAMEIE